MKEFTCDNCDTRNVVKDTSVVDRFAEELPSNVGKAVLVTVASVATGGIGGLILGGYFVADGVKQYNNGKVVHCGSCGHPHKI